RPLVRVSVLPPPPPTRIYTLSLHDALPISHMAELALWNAASIAVPGAPLSPVAREQQDAAPARKAADWYLDAGQGMADVLRIARDRKSTRLNSSHVKISYAVFCLKKKKQKE